jgi:hypothetical protein
LPWLIGCVVVFRQPGVAFLGLVFKRIKALLHGKERYPTSQGVLCDSNVV